MKNSILQVESINHDSFGTGFVIDSDKNGIYVLTCQHVLDDVGKPFINGVEAKVVSNTSFIDMAVLYVENLDIKSLPLEIDNCSSLEVEVIGFSHFNNSMSQKKYIFASLYKNSIELHLKDSNNFYNVKKIKAHNDFKFARGNSGSPVICNSSKKVIAMISNKEGSDIAYAIDILNLEKVWKGVPRNILLKSQCPKANKSTLKKDFLSFLLIIFILISISYFLI